jgi:hypothetical protein
VPAQVGAGPHAFYKRFGSVASGELGFAAPTNAALHRQRHDKVYAITDNQPGSTDGVWSIHHLIMRKNLIACSKICIDRS